MQTLEDFKKDAQSEIDAFEGWFILDHGVRNADEIARDIISFAMEYGFNAPDQDYNADDYSEILGYIMDEAIEYLGLGIPEGYWIGNDGERGAFGIWICDEE